MQEEWSAIIYVGIRPKTIDDMADAGSDMISVDNVVDLEHVKKYSRAEDADSWKCGTGRLLLFREQRKKWMQL